MEIAMAIALMIYIIFHTQRIKWIVMLKYIHRPRLLSYTENKMDSDADGFASFLTKNGFKLYKANTTENQNDFDVYEGKGDKSFLSLLNEYFDGDDGIRDFACAKGWPIGDWTCWYISSAYSKDEDLSNALKGNSDDDDVKIDYMVLLIKEEIVTDEKYERRHS